MARRKPRGAAAGGRAAIAAAGAGGRIAWRAVIAAFASNDGVSQSQENKIPGHGEPSARHEPGLEDMFVCGAVAGPDGSPVPCGSPAPTRTRWNALNCRRAWSATSEAMPLSVWADPVVMGGVLGALRCSAARGPVRSWARREPGSSTRSACLTCQRIRRRIAVGRAFSRRTRVRPVCRHVTARSRRPARAPARRSTRRPMLSHRGGTSFPSKSTATRLRRSPGGRGLRPRPSPRLPGQGSR